MDKRLKDIAKIYSGYGPRSFTNTNRQIVRLVSARDIETDFQDVAEVDIPVSYHNFLKEGDILVKSRGINHTAKVFSVPGCDAKYVASNTLVVVRVVDKSISPHYIAQFINSDNSQQILRSLAFGRTVPFLSPSSLSLIKCPLLAEDKQIEIENFVKILDEYQSTLEKYKKMGDELTKALKTKFMKGVA